MADFSLDKQQVLTCLDELETEYMRVGTEKCNNLEDNTQLSAFLRLGIRSVSLLRAMLRLLEPDILDGYDPVRRAFVETWQLQFEFRFQDSATKAAKWFQGNGETWKSDKQKLELYMGKKAAGRAGFGREWGELSELTHPTAQAAVNSCAVVSIRRGLNANAKLLDESLSRLAGDLGGLLNRQIWLTLDQDKDFLEIHISPAKLKCCADFHAVYMGFLEKEDKAAEAS